LTATRTITRGSFGSLILRGGYTEQVWTSPSDRVAYGHRNADKEFVRRRWSWHTMSMSHAHRIDSVQPRTRSLVFVGRRYRTWGFWTESGFIDWREYVDAG